MKVIYEIMEPRSESLEKLKTLSDKVDIIKIEDEKLICELKEEYPEKKILSDVSFIEKADMITVSFSLEEQQRTEIISRIHEKGKEAVLLLDDVRTRTLRKDISEADGTCADYIMVYLEGPEFTDEPGIFARKDAINIIGSCNPEKKIIVSGSITTEYLEEMRNASIFAADLGRILNRNINASSVAERFQVS